MSEKAAIASPKEPRLRTRKKITGLNVGDPIAIDITNTTIKGLPATVLAIYRDRIEYRYDATSPMFAGLIGHVRI